MGFRPAIEKIVGALPPKEKRQGLLFSATLPADVKAITRLALRDNHSFVDCIGQEEQTHDHVPQHILVCRLDDLAEELLHAL